MVVAEVPYYIGLFVNGLKEESCAGLKGITVVGGIPCAAAAPTPRTPHFYSSRLLSVMN